MKCHILLGAQVGCLTAQSSEDFQRARLSLPQLLQSFLLVFCLHFSPSSFPFWPLRQAEEQPPPDKVRPAIHTAKSRKVTEAPQNCGACFCSHLQTEHRAQYFPHTLVCHLQTLHPPDSLTILYQPISRFLSSSLFSFSWGLILWRNGKAARYTSTRLRDRERNT